MKFSNISLGATSIVKIGEVWLSDEIGGGVEISKKPNFIITIRYKIPIFLSVGPFFEEGGRESRKFRPEAEIFSDFFNWGRPLANAWGIMCYFVFLSMYHP